METCLDMDITLPSGKVLSCRSFLGRSVKTDKGVSLGWSTRVQYLLPADTAVSIASTAEGAAIIKHLSNWLGKRIKVPHNMCPKADDCKFVCLAIKSGHLRYPAHQLRMFVKTLLWHNARDYALGVVKAEMLAHENQCVRHGLRPALRLNGGSDVAWERLSSDGSRASVVTHLQGAGWSKLYDYTKIVSRMWAYLFGSTPPGYHLTFSRGSTNHHECREVLKEGGNVAAVFHPTIPDEWEGVRVVDGDRHDLRFLDQEDGGKWIGLSAKGGAGSDTSGFVIHT